MNYEVNGVVTIAQEDYLIAHKFVYENNTYLYLCGVKKDEVFFCLVKNDGLYKVIDKELSRKLLIKMYIKDI